MIKFEYYKTQDLALPLLGLDFFYYISTDKMLKSQVLRMRQILKKDPAFLTQWRAYFKLILWRYEFVFSIECRKKF